jgi:hypothetical protein
MRLWLLFGISFCILDQRGGYVLDLVVVVEPLDDEEAEEDVEEDLVVDAEEEPVVVEELPVEVDAVDEITIDELGCPPDNVNCML